MNDTDEIYGIFSFSPNPCMTYPCLPGLVQTVITEKKLFFLLHDHRLADESVHWYNFQPLPGQMVKAKGVTGHLTDIYKISFHTIDVQSIEPV
jgi:hypothetical protein